MVIGGGGREHAIIKKIKENEKAGPIYCLPGNGGIAEDATCIPISATDLDAIVDFALTQGIEYSIVTPDDPLVLGLVDRLEEVGIPCFGPRKNAAMLEGSKAFAKDLMARYGIPTASYRTFTDQKEAETFIRDKGGPLVVKASGLALGKGVFLASNTAEALEAVQALMSDKIFGKSGEEVVIEEYLQGPEVSVLAFTDGRTMIPMISSMDHKAAFDGDRGPNTGGMGAVAPNPYYTKEIEAICREEIFLPTMIAMNREGRPFSGCLYFGLMLTEEGPKVIEYNCRFGDPETQVILPLLQSDLLEIMLHVTKGSLDEADVTFSEQAACCVVMASQGYPKAYQKGFPVTCTGSFSHLYYAGVQRDERGELLTSGGRVLAVSECAQDLSKAIEKAYQDVKKIHFPHAFYRKDIGKKALQAFSQDKCVRSAQ